MERYSRRAVLIRGGALVAALTPLGADVAAAAAKRRRAPRVVYRLDPTARCRCSACQKHARNKLFATRAAAEAGRAHPGCRCDVRREGRVSARTWTALFGSPGRPRRTTVDRRRASTRAVLRAPGERT